MIISLHAATHFQLSSGQYPMSQRQACFAGPADACVEWLAPFLDQGVEHLVLRLASGDQESQFQRIADQLLPRLREARPA